MDYSKVNNALSGWQGSSARRDRERAELGQAMQLQQMNMQQQQMAEQKEQQLDDWMQVIQSKASQVAIRNEDRETVQGLYDQEREVFLAELEKAGNDPVKFMNSGGRRVMQNFYNNLSNSEEIQRIKSNTQQVQSYYEALEGGEGKNAHLISNQSRRDFNAFMEGDIDSFNHKQLAQWSQPKEGDYAGAGNKAQAFLNTDDNYRIFKSNYLIEYDLPSSMYESISDSQLENYAAGYVGGGKAKALQPTIGSIGEVNKSYGARVSKQLSKINRKTISTDLLKSGSQEYEFSVKDFDSGTFVYTESPENTDVVGSRGFQGSELTFAQIKFGENTITDLEGDTYISDVKADGTMYDENGTLLPVGTQIGSIQPMGVYLGYKIKTADGFKLVTADDVDGAPQDAEHVIMQEYQDDDYITSKERYYVEIDTSNPTKMAMLSKQKGIDGALNRFNSESGLGQQSNAQAQKNLAPLSLTSNQEDVTANVEIYDAPITTTMQQLGVDPARNIVSRSLLLALASGSDDVNSGISQLVRLFNADDSPELNAALVSGNSKQFFDLYLEGLVAQGVDQKVAIDHLIKVDELRSKIQKAHN